MADGAEYYCTACILQDRKSTRLNSSHLVISYAVFCLKKKTHQHNSAHKLLHYATAPSPDYNARPTSATEARDERQPDFRHVAPCDVADVDYCLASAYA